MGEGLAGAEEESLGCKGCGKEYGSGGGNEGANGGSIGREGKEDGNGGGGCGDEDEEGEEVEDSAATRHKMSSGEVRGGG